MDQFSHDLTVALEETSLLDRASRVRWGRRRTRSTGNLPCAPQPTEDSSSPTDAQSSHDVQTTNQTNLANVNANALPNVDGLDMMKAAHGGPLGPLPSESDEEEELQTRLLPSKSINTTVKCLESDSLNEAFSPARFFKPNARRKRKLKRMAIEADSNCTQQNDFTDITGATAGAVTNTGTVRKRILKPEPKSNLFFCGKRKRSNRDRYNDNLDHVKLHSSSMPRYTYMEESQMRPRSFSSTSKPFTDRLLLPLNKGLLSKIEKISQQQKNDDDGTTLSITHATLDEDESNGAIENMEATQMTTTTATTTNQTQSQHQQQQQQQQQHKEASQTLFHSHRMKKKSIRSLRRSQMRQQLQFPLDKQHPMDCEEFKDFLSSSSLSSSETDDADSTNDTDREGDDELTDWPGNEIGSGPNDAKRKLTKKSTLSQIKSDDGGGSMTTMAEDDTVMSSNVMMSNGIEWSSSNQLDIHEPLEMRYQPSEPITIVGKQFGLCNMANRDKFNADLSIPLQQIESEMSGETSNPFLPSPVQATEVREIRAGCRRIKGERPGFSIKTSVNERLARFLQDARQIQMRLPDIEIYEHESLINLATLYSLKMSLDNGCAVLTKTSNTTQSVTIDQHSHLSQSLSSRLLLSDFKRRCYDGQDANRAKLIPRK